MNRSFSLLCCCIFFITNSMNAQETPSTYTYQVGNYKITLLSESQQAGSKNILIGATDEMLEKYAPDGTFPNAMNAFLVQTPDKTILFDTGMGRKLFDNLASAGVKPEDINYLVITHMHGDHIGGMLRNEILAFPNAEVYLPKPEHDYWTNKEIIAATPENRRGSFNQAQKVIDAYKQKLHLFVPDQLNGMPHSILPGIRGIAAYGHTPGHTVFLLTSGNKELLIWADLTHAMAIQMPYPQIAVTYDVNPSDAIKARKEILEFVNSRKIPIAGMHIAYPAMGFVENRDGGGYRFVPMQ